MASTEFSQRSLRALSEIFGSTRASTQELINLYAELYGLEVMQQDYDVTSGLFQYCRGKKFFVNTVPLHGDHVFLARSLGHELGWLLPGSSVRREISERFEDAVSRILARDIPDIDMVELQPIAVLRKLYHYDGEQVEHQGLSFIGRVRHPTPTQIHKNDDIKGRFVSIYDDEELARLNDFERKLVLKARAYVKHRRVEQAELIDQEIDSTRSISAIRNGIHKILKPILSPFSSKRIKTRILKYLPPKSSVLDVACGDDDFIFKLAASSDLCVGNDIEWKQVKKKKGAVTGTSGQPDFPKSRRPPSSISPAVRFHAVQEFAPSHDCDVRCRGSFRFPQKNL